MAVWPDPCRPVPICFPDVAVAAGPVDVRGATAIHTCGWRRAERPHPEVYRASQWTVAVTTRLIKVPIGALPEDIRPSTGSYRDRRCRAQGSHVAIEGTDPLAAIPIPFPKILVVAFPIDIRGRRAADTRRWR